MFKLDDVGNAEIQGNGKNAKPSAYEFMGNNIAVSKFREALISEQLGCKGSGDFMTPHLKTKDGDSCNPPNYPRCTTRVDGLIARYESEVYQCQKCYLDTLNELVEDLHEESVPARVVSLWADDFAKCDRFAAAMLLYVTATHMHVHERPKPDECLFWIESHVNIVRSCATGLMHRKKVVVTYVIPYMIHMYNLMPDVIRCDLDSKAYLQALAMNSICEICTATAQHETCIKYAKMAICTLRYRFGDNQESCYFNVLLNLATAYRDASEKGKALEVVRNALTIAGKSSSFANEEDKKTHVDRAQTFEKAILAYNYTGQHRICDGLKKIDLIYLTPALVGLLLVAVVILCV